MSVERRKGGSRLRRLWYPDRPSAGGRLLGGLLAPFSWTYRAALRLKVAGIEPRGVDRPVVSIGNLTVGGNGKTPLVIEVARWLISRGQRVAVVSRGYGRATRGVLVANAPGDEPGKVAAVGDEPVLIARRCPRAAVVVGEDRFRAAELAIAEFDAQVILCDDAFQHRGLERDLDIVAVHAGRGFGNGRLLPAGPLREPLQALGRADMLVFTHAGEQALDSLVQRHGLPAGMQAMTCDFAPAGFSRGESLEPASGPGDAPVLAVCAIAKPEEFIDSLERAGVQVAGRLFFPDHHAFTAEDIERMRSARSKAGADTIVCTEKDLVRLAGIDTGASVFALRLEAHLEKDCPFYRRIAEITA